MKLEKIVGAICFVFIICTLTWVTVLENRTEKHTHSTTVVNDAKDCMPPGMICVKVVGQHGWVEQTPCPSKQELQK